MSFPELIYHISQQESGSYKKFALVFIAIFLKFLLFDLYWCMMTTFTPFSKIETYLYAMLVTLMLLLPWCCFRAVKTTWMLMLLLDGLLVSNLMYFRTYMTAIPLDSYFIVGNLSDFSNSVFDSLRWCDSLFFLLTIICICLYRKVDGVERQSPVCNGFRKKHYFLLAGIVSLSVCTQIGLNGGFRKAYESLQNANMHICSVPMYTLFGHLYYNALQEKDVYTTQKQKIIDDWMGTHEVCLPLPDSIPSRTSLVIILCESLESWVLERTVEGKEITPCLNALLKSPSTLYAPYVLTQVAGGRSIDCQLLLNAGLLPINAGAYSMKYPSHTYFTLTKAMKEKFLSKSYLFTVDKPIVWNQGVIARSFGIDSLLPKSSWVLDEKTGSRKKLGDESFFGRV